MNVTLRTPNDYRAYLTFSKGDKPPFQLVDGAIISASVCALSNVVTFHLTVAEDADNQRQDILITGEDAQLLCDSLTTLIRQAADIKTAYHAAG